MMATARFDKVKMVRAGPNKAEESRAGEVGSVAGKNAALPTEVDRSTKKASTTPGVTASKDTGKKKEKKIKKANEDIGSARGIETMFRTSYQAQLDMIALATTKANIMISLNGVLISVLLVSSAYLINLVPMLVVPIASLLLTCTVAIVFAVLAARPGSRREEHTIDEAKNDQGVLLIFEDFARFPADQYVVSMMDMLREHPRVYKNMAAHIHDMGQTANEKFNKLYIS